MTPSEEIQALKKQLNKERQRNRLLQRRLKRYGLYERAPDDASESFLHCANEAHLFDYEGYAHYLVALVRQNSLFRLWKRLAGYFRKLGLVSVTVRILSYILLLVQTGTVFFVLLLLFLIALPVLAVTAFGIYLTALLFSRRDNERMKALCQGRRVYVFFSTKEFSRGNFWKGNLLDLATRENALVVVISPYFFSAKGHFGRDRFYFNLREEGEQIVLIRKHYFFSLRRHVLSMQNTTLIY